MNYLLIIGLFIILIIAIVLNKVDFLSPAVIVSGVMFVSALCAQVNYAYWKVDYHVETVVLIMAGITVFVIASALIQPVLNKKSKKIYQNKEIVVNRVVFFFVIIINLITIIWHFRYVVSNVGFLGTFSSITQGYRYQVLEGSLKEKMPVLLSKMITYNNNIAFVFTYIFSNNLTIKSKKNNNWINIMPIVLFSIDALIDGARGHIVNLFLAGIIFYYIISQRKIGWKYKYSLKYIKKLILLLGIGSVVFTMFGGIIGRSTESTILYRICAYAGGGIPLFDLYLSSGGMKSEIWGEMTFGSLNKFLSRRFGIEKLNYMRSLEFRYHNGYNIGNVYTAFRPYIQDFGVEGMFLMTLIFSVLFTIFYCWVTYHYSKKQCDMGLLLYGVIVNSLFLFVFDDKFFGTWITPSAILYVFEIWLCKFFIVDYQYHNCKLKIR